MKRKIINPMILLFAVATIWGCFPGGADTIDDYDLVFTNYDSSYSFANQPKYTMSDKIVLFDGTPPVAGMPSDDDYVNQIYATAAINIIKTNMTNLGYTFVADTTFNPDFILLTGATSSTTVVYYDYWDYYGWYYPYGGYYPYSYVSSYTSGSLIMTLLSRKPEFVNPINQTRSVWTGIVNGVLTGTATNYTQRLTTTINQAFNQSPYLHQ